MFGAGANAIFPTGSSPFASAANSAAASPNDMRQARLSQGGGAGKPRPEPENLVSCTVKMAGKIEKKESEFFYQGVQVKNLLLVAKIIELTPKKTSTELILSDNTGTIRGWWYHTAGSAEEERIKEQLKVRRYVRVLAQPRENGIGIQSVQVITDPDEIPYHMIQACHNHVKTLQAEGRWKGGAGANVAELRRETSAPAPTASTTAPPAATATAPTPSPVSATSNTAFAGDMKRDLVIPFFKAAGERGAPKEKLVAHCATKGADPVEAQKVMQEMITECELYLALDADWYAIDA